MNNFNELTELWHSQKSNVTDEFKLTDEMPEMFKKVKAFEKKQKRIILFKIIFLVLDISFLIAWTIYHLGFSVLAYLGLGIFIVSVAIFMKYYLKRQFKLEKFEIDKPSKEFIKSILTELKELKDKMLKGYPLLVIVITIGLNIIFLDVLPDIPMSSKIAVHVVYTIPMFIAYLIGRYIWKRRYRKDYVPLIDYLEQINEDFKDNNK